MTGADDTRWARVQALFHEALEQPEHERLAYLVQRAGPDSSLVQEVLDLIFADALTTPLDRGIEASARLLSEPAPIPERVGPYRILERIGEGGMGVVYLARRDDLGSSAAIKFLRDAALSPARRGRFAREQRTLARLQHPGIATLYDALTLPDGTPCLVMEYVQGVPIVTYCDTNRLTIGERLRLFRDVCGAVQHAHSHAIIHRDLKPSNILVTSDGRPKLLDFGISKELEPDDAPHDATRTALRLMTPAYAAPEQVRGEPAGMHTDVYALGVILYELLTGSMPFDFSSMSPGQAESAILESDPVRPSVAAKRAGRTVDPLGRSAWADLDVIVATAMHKDPQHRYRTVDALVRDLDHFRDGKPLDARPPTFVYRAGKALRRHRRGVATAVAVATALIALATFYTIRLAEARDAALAEVARTQRIQDFLLNLFEGGDPAAGPADTLRVLTLVDRGLNEVQVLNSEPAIQASMYQTLGGIYQKLGAYARADSLLDAALARRLTLFGERHADVASSRVALGLLRIEQARYEEAEQLIRAGLDAARDLPATHPVNVNAMWALGRVLQEQGRYDEAIVALEEALRQTGAGTPQHITALTELANTHFYAGNYAASDSLNRLALPLIRQVHGERHPLVADVLINLGAIQFQGGRYAEAEAQYRPALEIIEAFHGPQNPATASALTMLGRSLVHQSRLDEASALLMRALAIQERAYGEDHPRIASILNELGTIAILQDDLRAAEAHYARAAAIYRSAYGERHYLLGIATANVASVYLWAEQYARAESLFREALRVYSASLPDDHLDVGITRIKLGRALARQNRLAEAEKELLAGHEIVSRKSDPGVSWLKAARDDLIRVYEATNRPEEAARWR